MKTLKALAALLSYPTKELINELKQIEDVIEAEGILSPDNQQDIKQLTNYMQNKNLLDLEEEYTELFDRTPSLCLNMFEHIYQDSRDRGQALSDLVEIYKEAGLELKTENLPDYLPLFLEYLSTLNKEDAIKNLSGAVDITALLALRLKNRASLYGYVFKALQSLSLENYNKNNIKKALTENDGSLANLDELDELWEEQMAFENKANSTEQNSCPQVKEMVSRIYLSDEQKTKRS